jgi:hypothetical protein
MGPPEMDLRFERVDLRADWTMELGRQKLPLKKTSGSARMSVPSPQRSFSAAKSGRRSASSGDTMLECFLQDR